MKLNGWTWLIAGVIISILSGYVYLFIPKDGHPNTAMALFFFIGIVFIVIGITKIFFRRMDDKSVMDSVKVAEESQPKIVTLQNTVQNIESKPNRIDETIAQMIQEEQQSRPQVKPQMQTPTTSVAVNNQNSPSSQNMTQHTNTFSKIYEYKGPVHTASTGTHAQHPVSQHIQQPMQHHTTAMHNAPQHPIHNTTEHSIKCTKCGNANPGTANYCHKCGNRLK